MDKSLLAQAGFLREVFDAIPAMLVIVGDDVRILHVNTTPSNGLGLDIKKAHRTLRRDPGRVRTRPGLR